ncbi:MAG: DUF1559 domain-containing protein [Gemmataceae bacterium]
MLALLSFLLGLASFVLFFFTGVPAILLGYRGLREVNESDGVVRGRVAAILGMITGCLGTLAGIIGMIALVLIELRGNAERVLCQDHLRRIGSSVWLYVDEQRHYPPGTLPGPLPPGQRPSWYVTILPRLEIQPRQPTHPRQKQWDRLADAIDKKAAWDAEVNRVPAHTAVRWFACPARPDDEADYDTSYVGLAGVGVNAADFELDNPRAGVFGYERTATIEDITRGLSATMLCAETRWETGPWLAGGPSTVRGLDDTNLPYIGPGRPWGGLHAGGLNILHADGSVQFVNQNVEPAVFQSLALIHAPPE